MQFELRNKISADLLFGCKLDDNFDDKSYDIQKDEVVRQAKVKLRNPVTTIKNGVFQGQVVTKMENYCDADFRNAVLLNITEREKIYNDAVRV